MYQNWKLHLVFALLNYDEVWTLRNICYDFFMISYQNSTDLKLKTEKKFWLVQKKFFDQ